MTISVPQSKRAWQFWYELFLLDGGIVFKLVEK